MYLFFWGKKPYLYFFLVSFSLEINHATFPELYLSYYLHWSRDSLSPVCGIFTLNIICFRSDRESRVSIGVYITRTGESWQVTGDRWQVNCNKWHLTGVQLFWSASRFRVSSGRQVRGERLQAKGYMWHVTSDMWQVTDDRWQVIYDRWQVYFAEFWKSSDFRGSIDC